jgi:hypothetical protein
MRAVRVMEVIIERPELDPRKVNGQTRRTACVKL